MTYVVIREGSNPPSPLYTEDRFSANLVAGVLTANELDPVRTWHVYSRADETEDNGAAAVVGISLGR